MKREDIEKEIEECIKKAKNFSNQGLYPIGNRSKDKHRFGGEHGANSGFAFSQSFEQSRPGIWGKTGRPDDWNRAFSDYSSREKT